MKNQTLRELFIKELQDLYDAENQIIRSMPKLIRAAGSSTLATSLEQHLEITKEQAVQLEELFKKFDQQPGGRKCKGMEGLLKEAEEMLKENMEPDLKDAAIIAAAQRIEHYEISGYGTVRTYAHLLGESQAASMIERILNQEKDADARLSLIAEDVSVETPHGNEISTSWKSSGASSRPSSQAGQNLPPGGHSMSAREPGEQGAPGSRSRRDS